MLEKLAASVNDGILFIYGGLFLLFIRIWQYPMRILTKFFSWAARIFVKAVSREIEEMAKAWLKPFFEEMRKGFDLKIDELRRDLNTYRIEKHSKEGELKSLKHCINNDEFSREDLKNFIKK
jgi:hypothetical protein